MIDETPATLWALGSAPRHRGAGRGATVVGHVRSVRRSEIPRSQRGGQNLGQNTGLGGSPRNFLIRICV